jgi:hypothetical protein
MKYLYCFANVSLTSRVVEYLLRKLSPNIEAVTTIYLTDRWVVRIKLNESLDTASLGDLQAFLAEHGIPFDPPRLVSQALSDLDDGHSPTDVMNRHRIVVVSHGLPQLDELKAFQETFVQGLGYCPQNLI